MSGSRDPGDVVVVRPSEEPPDAWDAAVFLAGPTPRRSDVASWRPDAIALLRRRWSKGRLVVFSPEPPGGAVPDYLDQVEWEARGLHLADCVLFWVPRELGTMPAFTTNVEWGVWHDSGRAVFGAPPDAPKNRYLAAGAKAHGVPTADTLAGTVDSALTEVGPGAHRVGGERHVPLLVWRTPSFQRWHQAQTAAGNTLLDARVVWTFKAGPDRTVHYWALHARMHVASEDRVKANEVVLSRPDVSAVVLYRRAAALGDTEVVLVREFRTPASTVDGFIHELPGGSGPEPDPGQQAIAEVAEETGLTLDPRRLRAHGSRQSAGTLSAHHVHVFSAELTEQELAHLRDGQGAPHGLPGSGERTWVEIVRYGELHRQQLVDWATLGMIAQVVGAPASR
jgi:8-oxo-dGTP pyrophosphatase MutT (NUDIX family)